MESADKELYIQIGKRLQELRENNGYTQEKFAEALGIGVEHYRSLENGKYRLLPERMLTLFTDYHIDPTYLITGWKNQQFDFDAFIANCNREQRDEFLKSVMAYMANLMMQQK